MTARGLKKPRAANVSGRPIRRSCHGLRRGFGTRGDLMAKTNPFSFLQDVRTEASKVTWPSRRETLITTGLVLAMVVVSSLFFLFTDTIIRWSLGIILGAR
jgi:preprotein translocase subunit SecE